MKKILFYLMLLLLLPSVYSITETLEIDANNQDALERSDGSFFGSDPTTVVGAPILVGRSGASGNPFWYSGFMFEDVNVPNSANITNAYLTFVSSSTKSVSSFAVQIYGNDVDNSSNFTSEADIVSRTLTDNLTTWNTGTSFTTGNEYNTSDISDVVQEIVDRVGWTQNNSLTIMLRTSSGPIGDSIETYYHEDDPNSVMKLIIEYTGSGSNTIISSLDNFYNLNFTNNINLENSNSNIGNWSYYLNGGSENNFANTTATTSVNLTNILLGVNNVTWSFTNGSEQINLSESFTYQPIQYFYFYNSSGGQITNYTLDSTLYGSTALINASELLPFGSKTILFEKLGYNSFNISFNLDINSQINNSYTLNQSKIVVSIYDRETRNLITSNTSLTLISSVGSTGSTVSGSYNFSEELFENEQYQIIATNNGYLTESIYFSFNNKALLNVEIYMLSNTSSDKGIVTIDVEDDFGQNIEGAIVNALEWVPSSSAFLTVAQGQTNTLGRVNFNVEIGTKVYKFQAIKDTFTKTSTQNIIQSDGLIIPIILSSIDTTNQNILESLSGSLTNSSFNSSHEIFTYDLTDLDGLITNGTLNIYNTNGFSKQLVSSYNATGTSFTIISSPFNVNKSSDTFIEALVYYGGEIYTFDSYIINGNDNLRTETENLGILIIVSLVLFIGGLSLGLMTGNIFISLILMICGYWLSYVAAPKYMPSELAFVFTVITLLIGWGVYKIK